MDIQDIYKGAENLLNQLIKDELGKQGHYLSGGLENSLSAKVTEGSKEQVMTGEAAYYAKFVNDGVPAQSASFKQFPFIVDYFKQRGLSEQEAKRAAAATINKWKSEGMPTQASKRFSSTGSRLNVIESVFTGNESKIDEYMGNSFDFAVNEAFKKEKDETI